MNGTKVIKIDALAELRLNPAPTCSDTDYRGMLNTVTITNKNIRTSNQKYEAM